QNFYKRKKNRKKNMHFLGCDIFKPCKNPNIIQNGKFTDGLRGWTSVIQAGSDPSASWYVLTNPRTTVNNILVPYSAPLGHPYALFEAPYGTFASGVLYQEVTIPDSSEAMLTFDWYA